MYLSENISLEEFGRLFTKDTDIELIRDRYYLAMELSSSISKEMDSMQRHMDVVEEQLSFARELVKELKGLMEQKGFRYKETKELAKASLIAVENSNLEL